jgi:hypothetical protein
MAGSLKSGISSIRTVEVNLIPLDTIGSYRLDKIRDIIQHVIHRKLAEVAHEQAAAAIEKESSARLADHSTLKDPGV